MSVGGKRGPCCAALWCNRRISGSVICVPGLFAGNKPTDEKIRKKKEKRTAVLKQLMRDDVIKAEKDLKVGKTDRGKLRYCKLHCDKDGNFLALTDDPVLREEEEGLHPDMQGLALASPSSKIALAMATIKKSKSPSSGKREARKEVMSTKKAQRNLESEFNAFASPDKTAKEGVVDEVIKLRQEMHALKRKIGQLEKSDAAARAEVQDLKRTRIAKVSYDTLTTGCLSSDKACRAFAAVPAVGLAGIVEGMEALGLDKTWSECVDESKMSWQVRDPGFRNSVTLVAVKCKSGQSDHELCWKFGISLRDEEGGDATAARRVVGEVFKCTIFICNFYFESTVGLPPEVAQVDRDTLPAYKHADLETVMYTADASNADMPKPHNPSGDKHSYSDYYGANCGKWELVTTNDGLPCWVSFMFGGRGAEKGIMIESNFGDWYTHKEVQNLEGGDNHSACAHVR